MVEQRTSINKVGLELGELVLSGGGNTAAARTLSLKLVTLCKGRGVYRKQYATHEERVLHRHLNLYKNKLAKATSSSEIAIWSDKLAKQKALIASQNETLDLDGL